MKKIKVVDYENSWMYDEAKKKLKKESKQRSSAREIKRTQWEEK